MAELLAVQTAGPLVARLAAKKAALKVASKAAYSAVRWGNRTAERWVALKAATLASRWVD